MWGVTNCYRSELGRSCGVLLIVTGLNLDGSVGCY